MSGGLYYVGTGWLYRPRCQSVCAVAHIIGKPETNIDSALFGKMLQLILSAAYSVLIPTGEAQGFTLLIPPRACCHIRP